MMNKKLHHIADIQFGVSVKTSGNGGVICFQISNIEDNGTTNLDTHFYADKTQVGEDDFLKEGDILLPSKGAKLASVVLSKDDAYMTIASSSLFVIRITDNDVLPEYLQWYLNLPRTQWKLQKEATGTNIASLSIRYLRKMDVAVPDMETQQKIIRLKKLQAEEEVLSFRISEQRKKLIDAITDKFLTNPVNP